MTDPRTADIRHWAMLRLLRVDSPSQTDLRAAIRWAEALDGALAAAGYGSEPPPGRPGRAVETAALLAEAAGGAGAPQSSPAAAAAPSEPAAPKRRPGRPRQDGSLSAYDRLSEQQRAAFDLVRAAYRLPTDREGAAATWAVLRPDPATAARILAAAIADAAQATPDGRAYRTGQARPYLMRWLRDRRWEETPASPDGRPRLAPAEAERRRALLEQQSAVAALARQIEFHERAGQPVPDDLRRQLNNGKARLAEMQAASREAD
jgi:hypothetical protein